jgi:aromatic ring-opening dioxygenase LigB subunit
MPHSPLLIPGVGKDNLKKLKKTTRALDLLEASFVSAAPELVVVVSPHGDIYPDAFTINTMPTYEANFEEFGDFETRNTYQGAISFINRFKEQIENRESMLLKSLPTLDYGCGVPLYYLGRTHKNFKVVPINYSFLGYEKHWQFGMELKEAIYNSNLRIALIASADLSHRLSLHAPGGFSPRAKDFDKKVVQILKQQKLNNLLTIDKSLIADAGECGLRSLLISSGVMQDMNYEFQVLSYESPFGVGCLVGEFKFK